DMAGLLKPRQGAELVGELKKATGLPIEVHTHATTGMSVATLERCAEAGAEILDTAISSLSMGTSHSPTETMVEIFKGTELDSGLDIAPLLEVAAYFREIRRKYGEFESSFLGADTRILASQIPGGMLSNLESQLKEQGASNRIDEVVAEIAWVHKDSGYPPLVTPTSQIVGTQAVFNVLFGRYARLSGEFRDLLVGRYGACPAPKNPDLVKKALADLKLEKEMTCRPADEIPAEWAKVEAETKALLGSGEASAEDVLTYAMFPKVAPGFFKTRADGPLEFGGKADSGTRAPAAVPAEMAAAATVVAAQTYKVTVNGVEYAVKVAAGGESGGTEAAAPAAETPVAAKPEPEPAVKAEIAAPVAGVLLRLSVEEGATVEKGRTVMVLESMKMELEIKAGESGKIRFLEKPGAKVSAKHVLARIY
ncbi:MAG: oxaloacetate decarboxylase, partial [Treponema sp.]|nr:oxaloacetate decarboxylase [Treponema sp.]